MNCLALIIYKAAGSMQQRQLADTFVGFLLYSELRSKFLFNCSNGQFSAFFLCKNLLVIQIKKIT